MSEVRVQQQVDRLREWVIAEALPFWGTVGFDAGRRSFVERIDFTGTPDLGAPRRAMLQARQIYVFAHASLLGWWPQGRAIALSAAHNLVERYLGVDGEPGFVFSVRPDGPVQDGRRDFYAQSFALFGLAWAYRLDPDPRFLEAALATLGVLDAAFAAPAGGYHSVLPSSPDERHQNPHMHLFEAMLAWYEATADERFLARAGELHGLLAARFFQPRSGILCEYFDGTWDPQPGTTGRICEPGHHYEWFWLLHRYSGLIGRTSDPIAERLKAFADRFGMDADGNIVDELLDDGTVHKASRRCWPHTEAVKANAAAYECGDKASADIASRILERLMAVFLGRPIAGGWIDHVDAAGASLVSSMPASTLYHVFLASAEADRVWGRREGPFEP